MINEGLTEIRCSKCKRKLAECNLVEGQIRILCMYNAGKGSGACRTLNIVTARRKNINNNINNISKDAI